LTWHVSIFSVFLIEENEMGYISKILLKILKHDSINSWELGMTTILNWVPKSCWKN
jgi:hypothetical protein